ncbi:hypothetical protein BDQ17DRAFT_1429231 [Cyathus striatus]|nr:hypothetical protein BDQ17DRAFT_1429231 [Cyathus striatus]
MPYFENASNFSIGEAHCNEITVTTNIVQERKSVELQYLYQFVASGASHDSKDQYRAPKCDPDTRKQLLSDILEWIKVSEKETGITFMHGPAGAGKSCITRSACEQAASEGLLGASFFFWRGSSTRNNENKLITTLAYQLAEGNKELREYILSELKDNPRIVNMPLDVQFRKLIFEPCCKLPRERLPVRVIVIDGLDECIGETVQIEILQLLAKAVRYEGFPLGIFITSRPELHLQEVFDTKEIIFATNIISLDRIPGINQDIRTVLQSGFIRIRNNPRFKRALKSVSQPWPSLDNIEKLVQRSSGQFIYSSTVLKFISSPDHNPSTQLEIVLGIQESGGSAPLADLDLLYQEIMSRVKDRQRTMKVLSYVMAIQALGRKKKLNSWQHFSTDILKAVLHNQNRLLLVVEQLLELPDGVAYLALNQLHSLISLNVGSESARRHLEIKFHHKSFHDFLIKESRSNTFYVDVKASQSNVLQSCLNFISHPAFNTDEQCVGWLYASFQWHRHASIIGLKNTNLRNIESALLNFRSIDLNLLHLKQAFEVLGLLNDTGVSKLTLQAVSNMQQYGILSLKDFYLLVIDVYEELKMGIVGHHLS